MYFFDPRMGNRRRVMIEDQLRHLSRETADGIDAGLRDLRNRGQGVLHGAQSLVRVPLAQQRRDGQASRSALLPKWTPGIRLAAASCGTVLMANCLARRTPSAVLLGTLGFGLFTRSLAGRHGGVEVQKTLEIAAPVDWVFEFFSHPENYMRVSDVVTNVEIFGDGRFAKDMTIAGIPVHFEERTVRSEKDRLLESHSEPNSALRFCKQLSFESQGENRTRLHMRFTYHPPGEAIGHAIASAFGIDAKTVLTELLMRAKYFLETGREPHDAFCHRRRRSPSEVGESGSAPRGGERGSSSTLQGPGAPAEDVHRPGMHGQEQPATWPASTSSYIPAPEPAGHFPPAV